MPNRGPRKILDIDAPTRKERKKPGPKPKPKPDPLDVDPAKYIPPPRKWPKIRYTNEQIIEVLQYLYYHRILDKKPDGQKGEKLARYRYGTILQKRPDLAVAPEGSRYRSPTYEEAAEWFQIPKSTVSTWWNTKLEMIGIKPETPPQAPMPDFLKRPREPVQMPTQPPAGQIPLPNGPAQMPTPPPPPPGQAPLPNGPVPGQRTPGGHPPPTGYNGVGPGHYALTPAPPQGYPPNLPHGPPPPGQGMPNHAQRAYQFTGQQQQQQPYRSPYQSPHPAGPPPLQPSTDSNRATPARNLPPPPPPPAPAHIEQKASVVAGPASDSTGQETATPTPSEQLADVASFNKEGDDMDKEMVSSEEEGVGDEEGEDVL